MMLKDNIKRLRLDHHLSQQKFAERLHVTQGAVSQWESGKTLPDTSILLSIASEFGVSLNFFNSHSQKRDFESLSEARSNSTSTPHIEQAPISDEDIRFALSGGEKPISKAQFDEVKQFVRFIQERDKANGNR